MKTEPPLPVYHGTNLSLLCDEEYSNKGGDKATCQDGQVVPTTDPPDYRGESAIEFIVSSVCYIQIQKYLSPISCTYHSIVMK